MRLQRGDRALAEKAGGAHGKDCASETKNRRLARNSLIKQIARSQRGERAAAADSL